jgi:ATP-dependent Clp protease ATP-binding subunit ClpA
LNGVISRYEEHHRLKFTQEALQAAASLAARYVSDRFLPDKAISIADLAGSRCRREGKTIVEATDVARIVAKLAGISEERLLMTDSSRLLRLEEDLQKRVVGHSDVVTRIAKVIRRNYAGFASRRPMGPEVAVLMAPRPKAGASIRLIAAARASPGRVRSGRCRARRSRSIKWQRVLKHGLNHPWAIASSRATGMPS